MLENIAALIYYRWPTWNGSIVEARELPHRRKRAGRDNTRGTSRDVISRGSVGDSSYCISLAYFR